MLLRLHGILVQASTTGRPVVADLMTIIDIKPTQRAEQAGPTWGCVDLAVGSRVMGTRSPEWVEQIEIGEIIHEYTKVLKAFF